MSHRLFSVVGGLCAALWLFSAPSAPAHANDPTPAAQHPTADPRHGKERQKANDFTDAKRALGGAAGNPECVWAGRRVVNLLWRDDLDTAFRHFDLYDRFGCPSGHIQSAFRCLILHARDIDPKVANSLNAWVQACWINPSAPEAPAPPPAVAKPTGH